MMSQSTSVNAIGLLLHITGDIDSLTGNLIDRSSFAYSNMTLPAGVQLRVCGFRACDSVPCTNGTCIDTADIAGFQCVCDEGFSGTFCGLLLSHYATR